MKRIFLVNWPVPVEPVKFRKKDRELFPLHALCLAANEFSREEFTEIQEAVEIASKLYDNSERISRVWETITKIMWNYPKCIDEGFHTFFNSRIEQYNEAIEYHDVNCNTKCKLCVVLSCVEKLEF